MAAKIAAKDTDELWCLHDLFPMALHVMRNDKPQLENLYKEIVSLIKYDMIFIYFTYLRLLKNIQNSLFAWNTGFY